MGLASFGDHFECFVGEGSRGRQKWKQRDQLGSCWQSCDAALEVERGGTFKILYSRRLSDETC